MVTAGYARRAAPRTRAAGAPGIPTARRTHANPNPNPHQAEYVAPEVVRGGGYGAQADFWALGVLLFEMLAGYPPFCADSALGVFELSLVS